MLLLIGSSIYASQVKTSELMPVEQKIQANFRVVPYDATTQKKAVEAMLNVDRSGVCTCRPAVFKCSFERNGWWHVCLNDAGSVVGIICSERVMGIRHDFLPNIAVRIKYIAVREGYRRQGVGEKLLRYHLEYLLREKKEKGPFFLETNDIELAEPIEELCKKLRFTEKKERQRWIIYDESSSKYSWEHKNLSVLYIGKNELETLLAAEGSELKEAL